MKHFLRLVGYECRKAFGNPGIVLFLAALLALNGWKIQDQYHRATGAFDPYKQQYQETYATYSGTITAEKAQKIMTIYRPLDEKLRNMQLSGEYDPNAYTYSEATDEQFFGMLFVYEMQYDYYYRNNAISIVENARTLAQSPNVSAYIARENTRIAWDFSGRSIPNFTDTRGSHVLLNYDYSTMLALLMCIFGLCGVFVREQESEMSMLLPTTRYGTGATVAAKLTAAVLFLLGIGILFYGEDFLVIYTLEEYHDALSAPIYSLAKMEQTPLRCTIGSYFLLSAGMRILGLMACGCLVLLLSSLAKQTLTAFLTGFFALFLGILLHDGSGSRTGLKWFNPTELLFPREMLRWDRFVKVFGFPMRQTGFLMMTVALLSVGMLLWVLYRSRSYHHQGRRQRHGRL